MKEKREKRVEFHPDAWECFERALDAVLPNIASPRRAKKRRASFLIRYGVVFAVRPAISNTLALDAVYEQRGTRGIGPGWELRAADLADLLNRARARWTGIALMTSDLPDK